MSERHGSMACDEARSALLAADPAELRGAGSGALATHLRDCARCRREAEAILHDTALLRDAVDGLVAERTARASPHAVHPAMRRRARMLLPLALAASLAAVIAVERGLVPLPGGTPPADVHHPEPVVPGAPVVSAVGGSGVAVMATSNPRITIVWTF